MAKAPQGPVGPIVGGPGGGGGGGVGAPPPPQDGERPLWGAWLRTYSPLQLIALLAFVILALAIAYGTFWAVTPVAPVDGKNIYRTLTVLITAAGACAFIAWLNPENIALLGRGLRGVLGIHRAALAAFVLSALATIAVAIFVALSSLFSGGPEDGVFALASIEFLLKLTAVSVIIVLITLRRPAAQPAAAVPPADGQPAAPPEEDRGPREFGGFVFAFSLVVIAALIVPRDDLIRLVSVLLDREKSLEDYLPSRPFVTVEGDVGKQLSVVVEREVAKMPSLSEILPDELRRQLDALDLGSKISVVLADNLVNQVERRGALPLLRAICANSEDNLVFSHVDDHGLAEHIEYLMIEGLIEYPYSDARRISMTRYGGSVVKGSVLAWECPPEAFSPAVVVNGGTPTSNSPTIIDSTVPSVPYSVPLTIGRSGTTYKFSGTIPSGRYRAELVAVDEIDPFLRLRVRNGTNIQEFTNDDSGPGLLDARLDFDIADPSAITLTAETRSARSGAAILRITSLDTSELLRRIPPPILPPAGDPILLVDEVSTHTVPVEGALFSYTPATTGTYDFRVTALPPNEDTDLVAEVWIGDLASPSSLKRIARDDDGGTVWNPRLVERLEANTTYYFVLRYWGSAEIQAEVQLGIGLSSGDPFDTAQDLQSPSVPQVVDPVADPALPGVGDPVLPEGEVFDPPIVPEPAAE